MPLARAGFRGLPRPGAGRSGRYHTSTETKLRRIEKQFIWAEITTGHWTDRWVLFITRGTYRIRADLRSERCTPGKLRKMYFQRCALIAGSGGTSFGRQVTRIPILPTSLCYHAAPSSIENHAHVVGNRTSIHTYAVDISTFFSVW